ncbi:MAG TPA: VWA domain-containing protein [Candidatus Acidoferrales bacterium]|nr:VWA domain-containing protein [Candidatus Acidoferrales bacterium]
MTRSLRYAGAVGLIVLGTVPLMPQRTGKQSADPVIRVTVDLVQVDAVVTNAQGRHVADLKPEDFEILQDGKPQKITHFSDVQGTAMQSASAQPMPAQSGPKQLGGVPAEANLAPAKTLRQDQVHRTIVMIADDFGLSSDDIPNVRKAMNRFVDRQMQAGDLVSIMTTSGGIGVMEQLTNDKRQLHAAIERVRYVPGRTGQTWYEPTNIGDAARRVRTESNARLNAIRAPTKVMGTLAAVAYAIQGLREMPGRKAIALFSGGFSQSVDGIVQLANRASVVLYTFDPRGLASFFLSAVDVCNSCAGGGGPRKIGAAEGGRQAFYRASQKSLDQMARGTGGIFFHDNNDLDQGLANALDDMAGYYLIGYQPQRADFDPVRGLPQFHRIEVKVLRPGLQVRSRNGFAGTPDPPAAALMDSAREDTAQQLGKEELRKALFSPFQASGFPVHLSAFYSASRKKDPKTGRRPAMLRAMLVIDAHALGFGDAPDGRKQLNLEVVAAAYGTNNEAVASSDKTFAGAIAPAEMNRIVASGLVYTLEIEIPKPGPYQLRIAAWDANSERAGSATTLVEIPDFNRAGIAVSSVQLYDSDSNRNEALTRAGVIGAGSPVTRVFAPGAVLQYDCTVYGSLIDRQTGKPKIDVAVRLFRGPEQIFRGQPIPLPIADGTSTEGVHATGEIKLPATLPTGDYALELTAYDRLEKKQLQAAAQWVDFTLVK